MWKAELVKLLFGVSAFLAEMRREKLRRPHKATVSGSKVGVVPANNSYPSAETF